MTPISGTIEMTLVPPMRDLGNDFAVRRILPARERRTVGPFVFLDHFGPVSFAAGQGLDVRPHPHIGLATVTYLFDGEILHRDSLGTEQAITPGAVNWMTAGRGIVHSERTAAEVRCRPSSLAGLQCWVALPRSDEETDPHFSHTPVERLPVEEGEGITARIITGCFMGRESPVPTLSPMFFVEVRLLPGANFVMPADYMERAVYIVEGRIAVDGEGVFEAGRMLLMKPDTLAKISCEAAGPARLALLGGEPLDGVRYVLWNFVSSSRDRIMQAAEDWRHQRFTMVAGDREFIPLPESLQRPVDYP